MYLQSKNNLLFCLYYQIKFEYLVKNALQNDDNGDLLADSCTVLNLWKDYRCHTLNVHVVYSVW